LHQHVWHLERSSHYSRARSPLHYGGTGLFCLGSRSGSRHPVVSVVTHFSDYTTASIMLLFGFVV
jgi:hypothetical protein